MNSVELKHKNETRHNKGVRTAGIAEQKEQIYLGHGDKFSPEVESELSEIQRFYSRASVFVTGATGLMGKVLIEKLLRTCPDVENIYIMMRTKKGKNSKERIQDLLSSRCFDHIKKENPDFHSKIHPIAGDVSSVGLGMSESDRHLLEQQVQIVFHMAATVRFDQHLSIAILRNVRGTREVLSLCRGFKRLKCIVHVSTAFSNCPQSVIEERLYDPPLSSDQMIRLAETYDADTLDHLSHKLVGQWPNTYTFSKALSEDAVKKYGQGLPIAVFRPTALIWSHKDPAPGWTDSLFGVPGLMAAGNTGLLRIFRTEKQNDANLVPCDMAVNAMLAFAWDFVENRCSVELPVCNYSTSPRNPLPWKTCKDLCFEHGRLYPSSKAIWFPELFLTNNTLVYNISRLLLHFLPALIADFFLIVTTRKPQAMKIYRKIDTLSQTISYFACGEWNIKVGNVEDLWNRLGDKDKKIYYFDMASLDWNRSSLCTYLGLRTYLMDDPPETILQARDKWQRLFTLHRLFQFLLLCRIIWLFISSCLLLLSLFTRL